MAEYSIESSKQGAARYIVEWLKLNAGMTTEGACGVTGNMYAECGFDPTLDVIDSNNLHAIGLCQWNGQNGEDLKSYANSRGKQWTDRDTQLAYLKLTLEDDSKYKALSNLYNLLKTTTDVAEASFQFCRQYEVCAGYNDRNSSENTKRRGYSQAIYKGVTTGGWEADGSVSTDTSVSGGISVRQGITPLPGNTRTSWSQPEEMGIVNFKNFVSSQGKKGVILGTHLKQISPKL